jgi:hypothetical protein
MQTPRRDIWTPLAGFAAAVTFVAGIVLASDTPDDKATDAKVLSFYANHGHRVRFIIGAYLLVFFALFLIWFAAGLRQRLRGAEGPGGRLTDVALGGGVLSAVGVSAGGVALASVSAGQSFGGTPFHTADVARYFDSFGFGMILIVGMFGAIALIDAVSIVIMRTGVLPGWLGWLGFICGLLLLFSVAFLPLIALPVWLIAASIVLWGRESPEAEAADAAPA